MRSWDQSWQSDHYGYESLTRHQRSISSKSSVFPATCVDRLTCWIKLSCSIKALNCAAFTSAGSLIRKLKSPTITCLPDKGNSALVSSLNWYLKSVKRIGAQMQYICFALYVSRKNRATPPQRVGLSVWMTEYPAGVMWPRLTVELLLHQVPFYARKSRWLSTISSYIESSLLIERQFKVAHLVPVVGLTIEVILTWCW